MLLLMSVSPFGLWVKEHREAQGLSMRDLAARTNGACTYGVIGQLETGRGGKRGPFRPSVEIVDAIAKALNQPIDTARHLAGYAPTEPQTRVHKLMAALEAQGIDGLSMFGGFDQMQYMTDEQYDEMVKSIMMAIEISLRREGIK